MSTPTDDPRLTADEERRTAHDRFGGIKAGCTFFGWLSAMGMIVVITVVLATAGVGSGLVDQDTGGTGDVAADTSLSNDEIGWIGVGVVIAIVLVAYYAGGYVAGRMARFDGARQGVGVILWTIVVAIVIAVVGAVAGSDYNVLDDVVDSFSLPDLNDFSPEAIALIGGSVLAAIIGAIVGGLAGMRFHRRVDRAERVVV